MKYDDRDQLLADAKKLAAQWKPRLALHDWNIVVQIVDSAETGRTEVWASTFPISDQHKAFIQLPFDSWSADTNVKEPLKDPAHEDLEDALVHELVHVLMSRHDEIARAALAGVAEDRRNFWDDEREALCDRLTRVLVALNKRAGEPVLSEVSHLYTVNPNGSAIPVMDTP